MRLLLLLLLLLAGVTEVAPSGIEGVVIEECSFNDLNCATPPSELPGPCSGGLA